jgi:hypothetical protein
LIRAGATQAICQSIYLRLTGLFFLPGQQRVELLVLRGDAGAKTRVECLLGRLGLVDPLF